MLGVDMAEAAELAKEFGARGVGGFWGEVCARTPRQWPSSLAVFLSEEVG